MAGNAADNLAIREMIENWVMWRDGRMWDRFRTVWHKDGRMWATWFQGTYEEFIKVSQEGYDRGVRIMHTLGGTTIDIKGKRAIAQTRMAIQQRAPVEGVLCDVTCSGKFYDFLEKRKGKWGIVLRRLAYEKDRIDPSRRAPCPRLTRSYWRHSRKVIATSPTCNPRSATGSRTNCPVSTVRRSPRSTPRAKTG